ncbi:MAG: hypothetical protein QXX85_08230 [Candidatus Nitrosotenuis sp.]
MKVVLLLAAGIFAFSLLSFGVAQNAYAHNNRISVSCMRDWTISCSAIATHDGLPYGGKLSWWGSGGCTPNKSTTTLAMGYGSNTFKNIAKSPCTVDVYAIFNGGHGMTNTARTTVK